MSNKNDQTYYFQADWILPIVRPPIKNGIVGVENGVISYVGSGKKLKSAKKITRLNGIILPGLVNAHTHLEHSILQGAIPHGSSIVQWYTLLDKKKLHFGIDDVISAIHFMMQKFYFEGIAAVGDHISNPLLIDKEYYKGITGTGFFEINAAHSIIGMQQLKAVGNYSSGIKENDYKLHLGFASVSFSSKEFFSILRSWQLEHDAFRLLSIHCSQSQEEIGFFLTGKGEFRQYLADNGYLPSAYIPFGKRPLDVLHESRLLNEGTMLINPAYINKEEIKMITAGKSNICWCPVSANWMHMPVVPIMELIKQDVNVCLGTESSASNPTMSIWLEMAEAASVFPELLPEKILKMVTINGARALKLDHLIGSIIPGKLSRIGLLAIDNVSDNEDELYNQIIKYGYQYDWYWLEDLLEDVEK
ncbi:MAG: amidohydrolase family protein [Calditrichia bacterium]